MATWNGVLATLLLFVVWVVWFFSGAGMIASLSSGPSGHPEAFAAVFFGATCVLAIVQVIRVEARSIAEAVRESPNATAAALRKAATAKKEG